MRPDAEIVACAESHARILASLDELDDEQYHQSSLLPGWSRAHVIAHLARKTESHVWMFDGARHEDVREQALAPSMRPDDFEARVLRQPVLLWELRSAFEQLDETLSRLPHECWDRVAVLTAGPRTMSEVVLRHLRDVEVHHVDLDIGYSPRDWPSVFVEPELERRLSGLSHRADHADLLAWLLDRAPSPTLGPW